MAEPVLRDVWRALKENVRRAWATREGVEVAESLEKAAEEAGIAGKEGRYAKAAATGAIAPGYREAAAAVDLGGMYRGAWEGVPDSSELKATLRSFVLDSWKVSDREQLADVIKHLDIPRLYKACAEGRFDEVAAAIGGPAPTNSKECYRRVAEVKKLSEEIRSAWGKV